MNIIKSSVIINHPVSLGHRNFIDDYCILGATPVHTPINKQSSLFGVTICNNNSIYSGTYIVKGTEKDTLIYDDCVIGQMCLIGHDCTIGNRVKIMNSCKLNGFVDIGSDTFIGTGSVVRNRINIGFNCFIGQNSNVVKDIPDNSFGYGNPFKVIRKNDGVVRLTAKKFRDMII